MTAEPLPAAASTWPVPPPEGYTVDDLFTLPDLPPHTELVDGSLVFVSPQRYFHSIAINLLVHSLRRAAPPELKVVREMTVVVDKRDGPERMSPSCAPRPLPMTIRPTSWLRMFCLPWRWCFWIPSRVTVTPSRTSTRPWESPTSGESRRRGTVSQSSTSTSWSYIFSGKHHTQLKLSAPFDIDIDLTEIGNV